MKIAILGAESTGKSQLAGELTQALRCQGITVLLVDEYLREWCDLHGRTPRAAEQVLIAHEQVRRVEAAQGAAIVIADTTALVTATYSELLFNDASLHDFATAHQRSYDVTLLTGLDLPWVADGLQRDGPHHREAADGLLRAALGRAGLGYQVVYGAGSVRLANALQAIRAAETSKATVLIASGEDRMRARATSSSEKPGNRAVWAWPCEKCSDPDCEHRLFSQLLR
jgi:nicotinamide riboside kinase